MDKDYLKSMVIRLCSQPRTFEYISKRMQGLDPIELISLLDELELIDNKLVRNNDYWGIKEVENGAMDMFPVPIHYLKKYMGHFDFLKSPHPLDFEWRNTTKSLNYLTELITEINKPEDSVLLMGMPTLFANICLKEIPQNVKLVERNEPIIDGLLKLTNDKTKIIKADIFKARLADIGLHQCVIMDPPWYTTHFKQFVWLAAQCLNIGGTLIISIPPINTRPNIDKERLDWFYFCQEQGLCIENLFSSRLEYAMPFFEFNALRAAGVKNILPFWRKGDVVTFRKLRKSNNNRLIYVEQASEWIEKAINGVRFRVNISKSDQEAFEITSIVKTDILPTVSSRDDRRKLANIWTSGNRIFNVTKPNLFLKFLNTFGLSSPKDNEESTTHEFIKTIIEFEKNEFNDFYWKIHLFHWCRR